MDPFTQGVLGAAAAGALARTVDAKQGRLAAVMAVGAIAGMAADLDSLVLAFGDTFLFLKYHRHFSHSLVFIPIGAAISALACHWLYFRSKTSLKLGRIYGYSCIGYATHGLLDCTTTYGTHLLWPFSEARLAWDVIGVIDPLFTIVALALVMLAARRVKRRWAGVAMLWMLGYLGVGWFQNERALAGARALALERGHRVESVRAIPVLGTNLLLWRTIYRHGERYYVNAVRTGRTITIWPGMAIDVYQPDRHFPWLDPSSQQGQDVELFERFSSNLLATDPTQQNSIIDLRYGRVPNEAAAIWGIRLSPHKSRTEHADYFVDRRLKDSVGRVWKLLTDSGNPL